MDKIKLTLKIAVIFIIIILASFIPDNFHSFFGDWECQGGALDISGENYHGCTYTGSSHGPCWHYGFRHWVWIAMGIVIFFVNISSVLEEED